jgi:hypothetical protein
MTTDGQMILSAFYKNCSGKLPRTETGMRLVLVRTVEQTLSSGVKPEDFSTETIQAIRRNIHDSKKRNTLVLEAVRNVALK